MEGTPVEEKDTRAQGGSAAPVTRAQFLVDLVRARGFRVEAQTPVDATFGGRGWGTGSTIFKDVLPDAWYRPLVALAYRTGLTEGRGDGREGRLGPAEPVSREEAVMTLVRAAGWMAKTVTWSEYESVAEGGKGNITVKEAESILGSTFDDWRSISDAGRLHVALALRDGLLPAAGWPGSATAADPGGAPAPSPPKLFAPAQPVTRPEAAAALARLAKAVPVPTTQVAVPGLPPLPPSPTPPSPPPARAPAETLAGPSLAPKAAPLARGPALAPLTIPARRTMRLMATAYGPNRTDNYPYDGTLAYLGIPLREGIIAVDPAVIPLGSHLYVEGYGYGVAADTGNAIKGEHIDLLINKPREEILKFGIKTLTVLVVS